MSNSMPDSVAAKIEDFFQQYRLRKYAKGQVLILNGDNTHFVYHLISGKVKEYDVTYRGDEIILNIFKPPAFFPMSLAINKVLNPYIYEAETAIEIRQAPADEVVTFIKDNPDVLFDLLSRVYRGVDGLLGRITHLMSSSAHTRVLYELIMEAQRFGTSQTDGTITLDINEKDLGARAGLSRETVSREITKLKVEGLIKINTRTMTVINLEELAEKIGQDIVH